MDGPSSLRGGTNVHGSGDRSLQDYLLGRTLGVGMFTKVIEAEHAITHHKVAIKKISKHKIRRKEGTEERVRREIEILRLLRHPHIIRLYEVIENQRYIYFSMELANKGDLFDYISERGHLNEDEARHFFQQIISGLEFCHQNMVAHRDLKPENLLLDSNYNVKICDFGFSNIMCEGRLFLKTSCGSPNYAAPEIVSGRSYVGSEVDVWSCGIILYALLFGCLPFDDMNIPNLYAKIKGGIYTFPSHLSADARHLISWMLLVDPLKRVTIPEIKQHPWFQVHLPFYPAVPLLDANQQEIRVDEDILQKVVMLGFERSHLVGSLQNKVQNKATVAYNLILDNQYQVSIGYLGGDLTDAVVDRPQFRAVDQLETSRTWTHENTDVGSISPQNKAEREWALCLQSQAHPREIMAQVLKALQELAVRWKKMGHYNMKCLWLPPLPTVKLEQFAVCAISDTQMDLRSLEHNSSSGDEMDHGKRKDDCDVVKFEMQLYKIEEDKYLLDLKRVEGPHFLYLGLCASFLAALCMLGLVLL